MHNWRPRARRVKKRRVKKRRAHPSSSNSNRNGRIRRTKGFAKCIPHAILIVSPAKWRVSVFFTSRETCASIGRSQYDMTPSIRVSQTSKTITSGNQRASSDVSDFKCKGRRLARHLFVKDIGLPTTKSLRRPPTVSKAPLRKFVGRQMRERLTNVAWRCLRTGNYRSLMKADEEDSMSGKTKRTPLFASFHRRGKYRGSPSLFLISSPLDVVCVTVRRNEPRQPVTIAYRRE